jgi:RNA polymerase sigma-70 factor (ECF subfamily)
MKAREAPPETCLRAGTLRLASRYFVLPGLRPSGRLDGENLPHSTGFCRQDSNNLELPVVNHGIVVRLVDDVSAHRSDEELIRSVADGDSEAFVSLFRQRRLEVYRFALHMTGLEPTAEDITQEVFMTVMRDATKYDASRGTVVAWLCGIARNLVKRRLERDRVLQPLDDGIALTASAEEFDPYGDLARAERLDLIRRAVMSLPIHYREVIVLCDLQELSYHDAAAALECAVGTVRSRLHRARALLAAKMRQVEHDSSLKTRRRRCFA